MMNSGSPISLFPAEKVGAKNERTVTMWWLEYIFILGSDVIKSKG